MTKVLIKDTQGEEEKVLRRQAEISIMKLQSKQCLQSPEDGRGRLNFPLEALEIARPCRYLDFGLVAFRTVREHISVILSSPVCGNLLQQL